VKRSNHGDPDAGWRDGEEFPIFGYIGGEFPEINDFTVSINGVSMEVALVENAIDELSGYLEKDGVSIRIAQLAKNSRVIVHSIEENILELDYLLGEGHRFDLKAAELYNNFSLFDKNDNEIPFFSVQFAMTMFWQSEDAEKESIIILDTRPEEKIAKAVFENLTFAIFGDYYISDGKYNIIDTSRQVIYSENMRIPEPGGKIEYSEPLVIYNKNGLIASVKSIERNKSGRVTIVFNEENNIHEGISNELISSVQAGFMNDIYGSHVGVNSDGEYVNDINLTEEDIANQSVRLVMHYLGFTVNGEWEIYFGE
jgi:hypothetical protein